MNSVAVVAFDLDQTLADTSLLAGYRQSRQWDECAKRVPQIPFVSGIEDVLSRLEQLGHIPCIASKAPLAYIELFRRRLAVRFRKLEGYRTVAGDGRLSKNSAIRLDQLRSIGDAFPLKPRVFIGDDIDDYHAALAGGWHFLHACWGGTCADMERAAHCAVPDDILSHIEHLTQRYRTVSDGSLPFSWDIVPAWDRYAAVLAHFSGGSHDRRAADACVNAVYSFKEGSREYVDAWCEVAASASEQCFAKANVTHVVPIISSRHLKQPADSPTGKLAKHIAAALNAAADYELFSQSRIREAAHRHSTGPRARREALKTVLQCSDARGKKILLVDDVLTTGASLEIYGRRLTERGGEFAGALCLARADGARGLNAHFIERLNASPTDVAHELRTRRLRAASPRSSAWEKMLSHIRGTSPSAYTKWTAADDNRLRALHESGMKTRELAEIFGRQPSAIHSRLRKLSEKS